MWLPNIRWAFLYFAPVSLRFLSGCVAITALCTSLPYWTMSSFPYAHLTQNLAHHYLLRIACWVWKKKNAWLKEVNEECFAVILPFWISRTTGRPGFLPSVRKSKGEPLADPWGGLAVGEQVFLSPLGLHPRLWSYLERPWGSGWAAAFLWWHFLGKRFQCLDFISQ